MADFLEVLERTKNAPVTDLSVTFGKYIYLSLSSRLRRVRQMEERIFRYC